MKVFEHKFVPRTAIRELSGLSDRATPGRCLEAVLMDLGARGWELVQITAAGAWLKREVEP